MKLRNKETGKVVNCKFIIYNEFKDETDYFMPLPSSLIEFNELWEDIEEPLIKDKKIRKAVRAWADANKIDKCVCKDEMHCITFETERGMFISFEYADPIPPEGNFSIAELCGSNNDLHP